MEFCGACTGGGEDKRLYLYGSGDHGCDFRAGSERAGHLDVGRRDVAGSRRAFYFREAMSQVGIPCETAGLTVFWSQKQGIEP